MRPLNVLDTRYFDPNEYLLNPFIDISAESYVTNLILGMHIIVIHKL